METKKNAAAAASVEQGGGFQPVFLSLVEATHSLGALINKLDQIGVAKEFVGELTDRCAAMEKTVAQLIGQSVVDDFKDILNERKA